MFTTDKQRISRNMEKDIYFSKMDKSLSVNFRMEASQEKDNILSTNNVWAKGIGKMAS